MNETIARRFCESPRRKLIVAIATILLGVVILIPLAEDYFNKKESRRALAEELDNARQTATQLPDLEKQVAKLVGQLTAMEDRAVSEDTLSEFRTRLVEMVRDSSCQIRRLDVASPTRRSWKEGDHPLADGNSGNSLGKATPFFLEQRSIHLSVNGRTHDIYALLEKLEQDSTLAHPERIELHSDGPNTETVTMDLDVLLFALSRQSS